jgi:hypothetical protein
MSQLSAFMCSPAVAVGHDTVMPFEFATIRSRFKGPANLLCGHSLQSCFAFALQRPTAPFVGDELGFLLHALSNSILIHYIGDRYIIMNTTIFKCFIASPGDTLCERNTCDKVFEELNRGIGARFKFRLETLRWEKDTWPSIGAYSQAVISSQLGEDYQIFIGIMHQSFGTATLRAGSGTEEEFDNAYKKFQNDRKLQVMFYFNDEPPEKLSGLNLTELSKIDAFKNKLADLGAYYWSYVGCSDFESSLRSHLTSYFLKIFDDQSSSNGENTFHHDSVSVTLTNRLNNSLCLFSTQPTVWVDPVISSTNEISQNPDENYENRIRVEDLIEGPTSVIFKAPPQFGLTVLSHHLVNEAWKKDKLWVRIDAEQQKAHTIHNAVKNEVQSLGLKIQDVECIVLDSWTNNDLSSIKKLKNLSEAHEDIPIMVMQTIDDSKFLTEPNNETIEREFGVLHLLALPRNHVRKVVCEYNRAIGIGEDEILLTKVLSDLEVLNIHRTPQNCITLLKVSEKHFDESPINRTNMLEMVLFILFNIDSIPKYKTRPDLKDCEYVLGRFCESLIRSDSYEFSRESFLGNLSDFCKEKLIDLEVDVVFDVLVENNIITRKDVKYIFRSSYWIFYFAAKRMHIDKEFTDFIFTTKKYVAFPEIIEFYTGIDRNRADALQILMLDIKETCDIVDGKVRLPEEMNPFAKIQWRPTEEQIEKVRLEISENVINSGLPDELKDRHADRNYNQIRPYNQSIQSIFEEYSLQNLMQKIKASSRALRNSDYVEPNIKRELLNEILRSWEQISKVLLALTPVLATKGQAAFEGAAFELAGDFGDTFDERVNTIIQCNPTNVVGFFKDDLFSGKMGPLLYDQFSKETNGLKKHQLALLFVFSRPRDWKKNIEDYIVSINKNSFYLFDIVNALRSKYRYDFLSHRELKDIEYLVKMGLAKHQFGDKRPNMTKIISVSNKNLPKREDYVKD